MVALRRFYHTQNCLVVIGYFRALPSDQGLQIIVTSEYLILISGFDIGF